MGLLKIYMVVNFRIRGISQNTDKLVRTPTLIKKQSLILIKKSLISEHVKLLKIHVN